MKYSEQWGPAPDLRRFEPELLESEQYPTLRYDNLPPIPWKLVPRGMIGYEEMKRAEMQEAKQDRKMTVAKDQEEIQRWAFVAKLACRFPQIGVGKIAEDTVPWDVEEFKRRVVEAQTRFLEEMPHGR